MADEQCLSLRGSDPLNLLQIFRVSFVIFFRTSQFKGGFRIFQGNLKILPLKSKCVGDSSFEVKILYYL